MDYNYHFNTSHVNVNHHLIVNYCVIVKHFNTSHVNVNLIKTNNNFCTTYISIHLMLMLIPNGCLIPFLSAGISIHLMLMLILFKHTHNILIIFISIHLMLMLIFLKAISLSSLFCISIHLMLMLILLRLRKGFSLVHFNTSHVNVNPVQAPTNAHSK